MSAAAAMELKLRSWRSVRRRALRGFATIDLPCGLQIADIMVVDGANGLYARLPQRPKVKDGYHLKGEDGTLLWDAPLVWQSRALSDAFSKALLDAVRQRAPQDLEAISC